VALLESFPIVFLSIAPHHTIGPYLPKAKV
jgi:hypothetical protein